MQQIINSALFANEYILRGCWQVGIETLFLEHLLHEFHNHSVLVDAIVNKNYEDVSVLKGHTAFWRSEYSQSFLCVRHYANHFVGINSVSLTLVPEG